MIWLGECSVAKVSDCIWTESPAERTRSFLICHASVALWVARTCAIWSLHIEMESEPGASSSILKWRQELHFRSYIRQSCQYFSVLFWRFASGERNIKFLRLRRRNQRILRPPDCNRTPPQSTESSLAWQHIQFRGPNLPQRVTSASSDRRIN